MIDHARALALIGPFEGRSEHMYLDRKGLVTCGVGNLLATAQAAIALLWQRRDGSGEPGPTEIADEWRRVSESTPGMRAGAYRSITGLDMLPSEIDRLFGRRVDEFVGQLERTFPLFEEWPDPAQMASLDMVFSLGIGKLTRGFPNFCNALRSMDWRTAAAHCHRADAQDARNEAIRDLYLAAARAGAEPAVAIDDVTTKPVKVG